MGRSWYESIPYQHAHTHTHTQAQCKLQASADTTSTRTHIPIQDRTHGKGHTNQKKRKQSKQNTAKELHSKRNIRKANSSRHAAEHDIYTLTYTCICNVCSCLQRTKAIAKRRLIAAYRVLKMRVVHTSNEKEWRKIKQK